MLQIKNIGQLISPKKNSQELLQINQASILLENAKIFWLGSQQEQPQVKIDQSIDAKGKMVVPGLIDCHSHLFFAGSRAEEFSWRMGGQTYQEIMAKGGGINNTVSATRAISDEGLYDLAKARANKMLKSGVTTLESKSGYGLNTEQEIRLLGLMKKLNEEHDIDLYASFLGAHVVPAEYKNHREKYLHMIIEEMLPQIAEEKLAKDCDVFCEKGAFSKTETAQIFKAAKKFGLGLRMHAEQLSSQGLSELLNEFHIKSLSHCEYLQDSELELVAKKKCVVELLPVAALFLRSANLKLPCVKKMLEKNIKLAIATDFNPGSAMCDDLILAARLSLGLMPLSIEQAFLGLTLNPALALGLDDVGLLEAGAKGDLLITNCDNLNEFFYDWTKNPVVKVVKNGRLVN